MRIAGQKGPLAGQLVSLQCGAFFFVYRFGETMRLKFLALGLAMATTALLSACGGGSDDDSGNAQVRLLNVSPGYASLDLKETDAATLNGAVALGSTGAYASLDLDTKGLYLAAAGSTTSLATPSTAGLTKDYSYTVVGWGASGALGTLTLDEQETAPDSGKSKVLILNLASGAGTVDVYLNKVGVASLDEAAVKAASIGTGRGDSYRTIDASAYRLRVTAAGNSSDVRLDVPSITLDSTKVYGVILVSSGSGNMVNAYVLPYKSSPTLFSNPTSNVRVISALPRSTTLSASLNGTSMFSGTASPCCCLPVAWWPWWRGPTLVCWCAAPRSWRCPSASRRWWWGSDHRRLRHQRARDGGVGRRGARRPDRLALGNVVGSNIFNVLFILGLSGADHAAGGQPAADPAGGADHDRRRLLLLVMAWTAASAPSTPPC
jgi:hypothetical protein